MKDDMEEKLILTDSESLASGFMSDVPSNIAEINTNTKPKINSDLIPQDFKVSPQELTNIVNKYKERDENMQDIKYFKEKNGIDRCLED